MIGTRFLGTDNFPSHQNFVSVFPPVPFSWSKGADFFHGGAIFSDQPLFLEVTEGVGGPLPFRVVESSQKRRSLSFDGSLFRWFVSASLMENHRGQEL